MRARTAQTIATGLVAGIIGFVVISAAFLLLDVITGRGAGFTPALLAGALFQGSEAACQASVSAMAIAGYSALHFSVFLTVGLISAWLFSLTSGRPWLWSLVLFIFVFITFHLYGMVLVLLAPVRTCFSLYYVMAVTSLAAMAMLWYLLRERHGLARDVTEWEAR